MLQTSLLPYLSKTLLKINLLLFNTLYENSLIQFKKVTIDAGGEKLGKLSDKFK